MKYCFAQISGAVPWGIYLKTFLLFARIGIFRARLIIRMW